MNREILFRGKRIDNGERIPNTNLTLIEPISMRKAVFKCDCGNETVQYVCDIERGNVKSCGCARYRELKERNEKHGGCGTRLYAIWRGMHKRCYNKNATDYYNYGARGIRICDEWKSYNPFYEWSITHGYSDDLTIDRLDENGMYEPKNCRWATHKQQSEHRRNRASLPERDSLTGRFIRA